MMTNTTDILLWIWFALAPVSTVYVAWDFFTRKRGGCRNSRFGENERHLENRPKAFERDAEII